MTHVRGAGTEVQQIFVKVISVLKEVVCISKWCHCARRTIAVPKKEVSSHSFIANTSANGTITEQLQSN